MEKKKICVAIEEQETVVNFGRNDAEMTIYTTDSTMITKLDKCVLTGAYKVIEEHTAQGVVIGKTYKASKRLLSFRTKNRVLTEKQKENAKQMAKINFKRD